MPEDEASTRRLMQRLDLMGDRAGAIEAYEGLMRRLATEYELDPAPETSVLAESIRSRRTRIVRENGHVGDNTTYAAGKAEMAFAVLPFDGDAGDCLADGLTDAIVIELSRVRGLRTVCQASSAIAKARATDAHSAAGDLNVDYLLTGSLRRLGPELEVTARLLDVRNRRAVWAEQHTGAVGLLPEIRDALVARVARTLRLPGAGLNGHGTSRSPEEQVLLLEANQLARRQLSQWTPEALDRAIMLANEALEGWGEDEYLLATLGQGHLPHVILGKRPGQSHLLRAEACAERMMAINPECGRAYLLRALVRLRRGNSRECAEDLRAALRSDPNNPDALFWLSLVYVISGRGHQAKPAADRLIAVDPMNSTTRCIPGYIEAHRGFFDEAHPHYQTMYRMEPESPVNRWCYSQLLVRAGRTKEAGSMMEGVIADAAGTAIARQASVFLAALRGDRVAAQRAVTTTVRREARWDEHGSWWLSSALSIAGRTDEALYWLANAVRLGYIDEPFLSRIDPCLEHLRGARRFRMIMDRAKRAYDRFDG
jgi:non-specific serine/threonine protein kinase